MRILALGGCGDMGSIAVREILHEPSVSEIVIADHDQEKATRFAASLGRKARAIHVDAHCDHSLRLALQGCDVVMSTIGPYYLFGRRVLSAALEAGVHYIDICDDPEPTLEMLALDAQARDRGVTAIIGAGASPGISNLLAARALAALPQAEEIYTFWGTGGPLKHDDNLNLIDSAGKPSAATYHWVQQASGSVKIFQHGAIASVTPLQCVKLALPGRKPDRCHIIGHPEPLTLPRTYPHIKQSLNLMNMPGYIIYALEKATRRVDPGDQQSLRHAAEGLAKRLSDNVSAPVDIVHYLVHQVKDRFRHFLFSLGALARGPDSRGKTVVSGVHMRSRFRIDDMAHSTCLPTAIILKMLIDGTIMKRGVMAPEACVPPDNFFQRLAQHMVIDDGFDQSRYVDCVVQQTDQIYAPLSLAPENN
ncbi:MAG: saccharopine dehydrogenase NADP-binding domain-containing protein [Pseudomonadales bacterium]|nr:saccharopine dehydrogenase NADP-binding domain-containing protein [Pseudomonadales bacterium]